MGFPIAGGDGTGDQMRKNFVKGIDKRPDW